MSKISIKNVKHAEFASEETHCFTATVYKDGKRWCTASNDGRGGCTNFTILNTKQNTGKLWDEIAEFDKAQPMRSSTFAESEFTYRLDLEHQVNDLLEQFLKDRDIKRYLKRVCYVKPNQEKGAFCQLGTKFKPNESSYALLRKQGWWTKDCVLLNTLPIEQVREYL